MYMYSVQVIYNGILVPVRTSFGLRWHGGKMYNVQHKVDVDMLNAVKSVLASLVHPTHSLRHSSYLHQPYVNTLYVLQVI